MGHNSHIHKTSTLKLSVGTKCVYHYPLSFDDNKVLKKCQLDMLIFVQMCRTIDKNFIVFNSSRGSEEKMKSIGIYKKEARRHLNKSGSEDKRF